MTSSIIIPTYQRSSDLDRLLSSIERLTISPTEILVIIGPDDPESWQIVKKHREVLSHLQSVQAVFPSLIHAMNLGLDRVDSDIICFLDDDASVPTNWLAYIVNAFNEDRSLGAFGGQDRIQLPDEPILSNPQPARTIGRFHWSGRLIGNHHRGSIDSIVEVDVLKGVNLSIRTASLHPLQIDSELIGKGAETCSEIDMCSRISAAGYKIRYDNQNWVDHYVSARSSGDSRVDLFASSQLSRTFNEFFVAGKYRPNFEVGLRLVYGFLIGSRKSPGIIVALTLIFKTGPKVFQLPFSHGKSAIMGLLSGYRKRNR